jgi:hypothetical protein
MWQEGVAPPLRTIADAIAGMAMHAVRLGTWQCITSFPAPDQLRLRLEQQRPGVDAVSGRPRA